VGGTLDVIVWLLIAALLLFALAAVVIAARRFLLERRGGTIECGLRPPGASWRPGIVSYHRDELYWYRALGVLLRPGRVLRRRSLSVRSRRPATAAETRLLGPARWVIELDVADPGSGDRARGSGGSGAGDRAGAGARARGELELAMTEAALTGFLSWLEASPPSSHLEDIA
jgi:hypothetical protein